MQQENVNINKRMNASYRPLSELIRGILFILCGLYIAFYDRLAEKFSNLRQLDVPPVVLYIVGGLLCAYGLYRVYRGVKQLFY